MSMLLSGAMLAAQDDGGVGIPTDYESYHSFLTDASDSAGNHAGNLNGGAVVTGGELVLNGSTSYVAMDNLYPATSALTISLICNADVLKRQYLFGDFSSGGASATSRCSLGLSALNRWEINLGDGTSFYNDTSVPHTMSATTYYEVQYEINGTSIKCRVNGVENASYTSTVALSTASSFVWTIGRLGSFNGLYFDGKIKEVYRYHRVLTGAEQSALTARL